MIPTTEDTIRIAFAGVGATAVLDAWSWTLRGLGVPSLDFALLGRWVAHLRQGQWRHDPIARTPVVRGEAMLGWTAHYVIGVVFAALLAALAGCAWFRAPTLGPALAFGVATVAAPWFVMQPAMGAGIAASRTPAPMRNALRNLINHTVFGLGLFAVASLVAHVWA